MFKVQGFGGLGVLDLGVWGFRVRAIIAEPVLLTNAYGGQLAEAVKKKKKKKNIFLLSTFEGSPPTLAIRPHEQRLSLGLYL